MGKDISKSIRLSQEAFDYINNQPGSSFNDKLDRLVLLMDSAVPQKLAKLRAIDVSIEKERNELIQLSAKIDRLRQLIKSCDYAVSSLDRVLQSIAREFPASD